VAGPRPVLLEHDLQHLAAADPSARLGGNLVGASPQVEARLRLTSIAASAKVAVETRVRLTSISERRRSELPRIQCFIEAGYARRGAF
jgi:hypothetical protein